METPSPSFRYARGLDGVRALAVVAVVVYHLGTTGGNPNILRGGFLGVDMFFVLSGYLITGLLIVEIEKTGRISIGQFYRRRARRLLPALFALLIVVGAASAFWFNQNTARLRGELVAAVTYSTNWWLIGEKSSYFGGGARPSLLTHLWSLAVEEQFYLVWPIVLILLVKLRIARRTQLVILMLAATASAIAAGLLYDPWTDPSRVYYGTDTRALAPLIGAALAILVSHRRNSQAAERRTLGRLNAAGYTALVGLAALAWFLPDTSPLVYRGGFAVIAVLAATLIAAAITPGSHLERLLGNPVLRWIGDRSYAIYLWHWPVFVLTRPGIDVPITGLANVALRLIASVVLAELSHRLIEQPFRHAIVRRPSRREGVYLSRPLRQHRRHRAVLVAGAALSAVAIAVPLAVSVSGTPAGAAPVDGGPGALLGNLPTKGGANPSSQPGKHAAPTVAVFGDSQGMTLLLNKPADLGKYIKASDATIEGCGVMLGRITSRSGERRNLNAACNDWTSRWASSADRLHPQIALVMIGAWEMFDIQTDSGTLTFGSPAWDAYFTDSLQQGVSVLNDSGATVALALLPCYRPIQGSAGYWPERGDDQRTQHVNDLLRKFAADSPAKLHLIDPPSQFCTDRAIATNLNYRWDGMHYYKAGAELYFRTVVPQLQELGS